MTKKQKIWLILGLALFVVPEILWSPLGNFYYELSQTGKSGGTSPFRDNLLQNTDNLSLLKTVLFIQLAGVLIITFKLFVNKSMISNSVLRSFIIALCLLVSLLSIFALYFVLTFSIDIL